MTKKHYIWIAILLCVILLLVTYKVQTTLNTAKEQAEDYKGQMQQIMDETCYDKREVLKEIKEKHNAILGDVRQLYIDKAVAMYNASRGTGDATEVTALYQKIQVEEQKVSDLEQQSREIRKAIVDCVQ